MKTKITFIKKTLFLFTIALFFNNTIYAQCSEDDLGLVGPYDYDTLTESDGIRNGPDYRQATVYYPTNATGPYASVVLVPGWTNSSSAIASWGPFYASHGIVAFIVNVNNSGDFPDKRADALLDAIETLKQENTRSGSPLRQKLDTSKFAVSGYSMGGGGAQIAADRDSSIKAVVGLAPWLPNANSGTFADNVSATLLISAQGDGTASPSAHANRHYASTPNSTEKALFELRGGSHSTPQLPQNVSGNVGKVALAWLKVHLEETACFCSVLTDDVLVDSSITNDVQTSFNCTSLSTDDFETNNVTKIYPNPASSEIFVKNSNFTNNVNYNITNVSGQLLMSGNITSSKQKIDISSLASSVYFLNIGDSTFKVVKTN